MNKQIAILRGINVGGKRKILMTDLKELFSDLGADNIQTYIQSGNVIFNSTGKKDNIKIANEIEEAILNKYDFQVPVIVLSAEELNATIAENPFLTAENMEVERLHVTFLKELPQNDKLQNIESLNFAPDLFEIRNKKVFIYCSGKYHTSKLTNNFFESKLKVPATTRNWKTVIKLGELANGDSMSFS